jgi:hypothetical protein
MDFVKFSWTNIDGFPPIAALAIAGTGRRNHFNIQPFSRRCRSPQGFR